MNKNYIDEVLEEFDDKWKMSIEASGFMKNDRRGIEFYVVKEWLKQKLQQISDRKVEEIRGEIKENKLNYSINSNQHRQDIGFGYNKAINDTLNLKSLKTKE